FAQQIGMPLAGPGKFDDALGDDSVRKIVRKAEGRASHFKRNIENSLGFGIGVEAVQVARDSHGKPPPKAISSVRRLARSAIYSRRHHPGASSLPQRGPQGLGAHLKCSESRLPARCKCARNQPPGGNRASSATNSSSFARRASPTARSSTAESYCGPRPSGSRSSPHGVPLPPARAALRCTRAFFEDRPLPLPGLLAGSCAARSVFAAATLAVGAAAASPAI